MRIAREINSRGWLQIGMITFGNLALATAGWSGQSPSTQIALVMLSLTGIALVVLGVLNRGLVDDSLDLSKELLEDSLKEGDFIQTVMEDYLQTIKDLSFHDRGRTAVHYSRLREALVKRYPEMEMEITKVEPGPDLLKRYL